MVSGDVFFRSSLGYFFLGYVGCFFFSGVCKVLLFLGYVAWCGRCWAFRDDSWSCYFVLIFLFIIGLFKLG